MPDATLYERMKKTVSSKWFLFVLVFLAVFAAAIARLCGTAKTDRKDKQARTRLEPHRAKSRTNLEGLTRAQRNALIKRLSRHAGSPVWFATYRQDPRAVASQRRMEDIFTRSGWKVRGNKPVPFRMKPGVFFLMADTEPPRYALEARAALEATGLKMVVGSGYRAYFREMKQKNPNWGGFDLAPGQTFVIVIGPQQ